MTVVEQLGREAADPAVATRRTRAFGIRSAVVALILVAATITAGVWWFRGGTYLRAAGGGYGGIVLTDEQMSVGIDLTTVSGPGVVLDGVSARASGGARVSWSVYRSAPGALGFGSAHGPLRPRWLTEPVHGYRVAQPDGHPERGATWLVATMSASHPGVYRLSDITVRYRSARRVRRSAAHTSVCALVVRPADEKRFAQQSKDFQPHITDLASVDPLVAEFETCSDPTLGR